MEETKIEVTPQILQINLQTLVEIVGLIGASVATVVGLYISLIIKMTKLQIGLDTLRRDINNLGRSIKGRGHANS